MNAKINNESYPSLTSNHTKRTTNCNCEECSYVQEFNVTFDYSRKSKDGISIESFTIYDKDMIDVSDKLNVRDYERLMVDLEDKVACHYEWTPQDEEERVIQFKNYHYY